MFYAKEHNYPGSNLNKRDISDLPNKDFKIMVIKMFTEVSGAMHEKVKIKLPIFFNDNFLNGLLSSVSFFFLKILFLRAE